MSVAPIAPALPVMAPRATSSSGAGGAELHVSTVDGQGRLALRGPALAMGWMTGLNLHVTVRDGVMRLAPVRPPEQTGSGVAVRLDNRWRVLIPYGVRVINDLESGGRMIAVAAPNEGIVAVLAVSRVLTAFVGSR